MLKGTIVKLVSNGFGFINGSEQNIYFHHSSVEWGTFSQLEEGQDVEYELTEGPSRLNIGYPGGPQAKTVRPA